ncbi:MAG: hypothetical protein ANABAC_1682 [Anaerolineae bacterium]|jgi:hypothetical protein|nr:MAG: hypothetical protein ANABAC_1682 [Anaerolineae bacterium]
MMGWHRIAFPGLQTPRFHPTCKDTRKIAEREEEFEPCQILDNRPIPEYYFDIDIHFHLGV